MFKNFQLGTKIVFVVLLSVFIVLFALTALISIQSYNALYYQTNLLVGNANARNANKLQGYINQVTSTMSFAASRAESTLKYSVFDENQMKDIVESLSESSNFIEYAYIIGTNSQAFIAQNGKSFTMNSKLKSDLLANTSPSKNRKIGISKPIRLQIQNRDFTTLNFTIDIFNFANQKVATLGVLYNLNPVEQDLFSEKRNIFKGDRRFLITQDGVLIIHPNKEFVGKNLKDINVGTSAQKIVTNSMNNIRGIVSYDFLGINYIAGVQPFEVLDSDTILTMISLIPNESVYESLYDLLYIIIMYSIVGMIIIAFMVFFYVKFFITQNIHDILKHLLSFFDYINFKTSFPPRDLRIKSNDELGKMGKMINENILATKKGLEQDNQAVKESVQTV
ncbi:methyl-accepting chemotaxis protein, partial [Campylobacter jejuni]|nr:methyl-accepting chemotaxis protein [Campylobacter jejuni]